MDVVRQGTTVRRIVANLPAPEPRAAAAFYEALLGLRVVMDAGWMVTLSDGPAAAPQMSVARQGGSGTPLPAVSIEVDDVDAVHARALDAGYEIVYPMTEEPWGVRRFYVRDPGGNIVNILSHAG